MKKMLIAGLLLSTTFIGAQMAEAAPGSTATASNAESEVNVTITEDETAPDQNTGNFYRTLAIVHKPVSYNFTGVYDENALTSGLIMSNNTENWETRSVLTVNDNRRKSFTDDDFLEAVNNNGWEVSAGLSALETATGEVLSGAIMTITPGDLYKYAIGTDTITTEGGQINLIPKPADVSASGTLNTAPEYTSIVTDGKMTFNAGGSSIKILEATNPEVTSTQGGVSINLGDAKMMAAGNAGVYKGKMTYTLTAK